MTGSILKAMTVASLLTVMMTVFLPVPAMSAASFILSGQVTDIGGKPVAGAEIFAYDSAVIRRPADFISARTAVDGRYSLTLPSRKFWVVARVRSGEKFGPLLPGDRHSGEPLVVEPDDTKDVQQDFTVVDIREAVRQKQKVRADFRLMTGRILDQDGRPVSGVYAFAGTAQKVKGIPEYISAWTGANGEYALYLPPGHYFLGVGKEFPLPTGTGSELELTLEQNKQPLTRDITVKRGPLPESEQTTEKILPEIPDN